MKRKYIFLVVALIIITFVFFATLSKENNPFPLDIPNDDNVGQTHKPIQIYPGEKG